jgi:hypothetical protein
MVQVISIYITCSSSTDLRIQEMGVTVQFSKHLQPHDQGKRSHENLLICCNAIDGIHMFAYEVGRSSHAAVVFSRTL